MAVEVTISSARDLKNVNWRYGPLKPYAVVWVDSQYKFSTSVDREGDTCPYWDQTFVIPLTVPINEASLHFDIFQADARVDIKPFICSAWFPLWEIVDEAGVGESVFRTLQLRRPSGRPHGKLEAKIVVFDTRYRAPDEYYAPSYGVPPPQPDNTSGDYSYSTPYGYQDQYAPQPYAAAPPTGGYAPAYGQPPVYGYGGGPLEKKKSKFGMGTGLAVGAVARVLGGLALAEGAGFVEDKIAENAAETEDDDLRYDNDSRRVMMTLVVNIMTVVLRMMYSYLVVNWG